MDLAHSAPDRVALDLLLKLSAHDEDWYVEAPANAALKAMARFFPAVLHVFYVRLRSPVPEERAHAAQALCDIAEKEPELLDPRQLSEALIRLKQMNDKEALAPLRKAISKMNGVSRAERYRYGL
jgi:HEAT repeat protein